jgi:integrase
MAVRKRIWKTNGGESREAWVVDYTDQAGERHIETFDRKKDADARHADVKIDVKKGIHVAAGKTVTVAEAATRWIEAAEVDLERATAKTYREHVRLHIVPYIGRLRLSDMSVPMVSKFRDTLRQEGRSPDMVRRVLVSLGSIIADAQDHGLVAHNAVRELRRNRKRGKDRQAELRRKGKLKVGKDIPTPDEISLILHHAPARWRPVLLVAAYTGLRASELRGLRWEDVSFEDCVLHVRQRADRLNDIGAPKSAAGHRTVPFGKIVANTLKEWKLRCPHGELVFPTSTGRLVEHSNLVKASLIPACVAAGLVTVESKAKYTGLHVLRHFYASWCIDRELPPKVVQERLGHSSITMTFDRYGHLFPRGDDGAEIDAAELALISRNATRA